MECEDRAPLFGFPCAFLIIFGLEEGKTFFADRLAVVFVSLFAVVFLLAGYVDLLTPPIFFFSNTGFLAIPSFFLTVATVFIPLTFFCVIAGFLNATAGFLTPFTVFFVKTGFLNVFIVLLTEAGFLTVLTVFSQK